MPECPTLQQAGRDDNAEDTPRTSLGNSQHVDESVADGLLCHIDASGSDKRLGKIPADC